MMTSRELYELMFQEMGPQGWWPADDEIEMMIGAILVQNTSWTNVEKSLIRLKNATQFNPEQLAALTPEELQELIRPSGYFKNKSKALIGLFEWLKQFNYDYDSINEHFGASLRSELLKLHGVGPETADVLLVYLFGRVEFIPDSYTRRLYKQLGYANTDSYNAFKKEVRIDDFTNNEAKEFHGLLDEFGKKYLSTKVTDHDHFLKSFFKLSEK
ncbi:endonuclease III domain-containing protein [Macrococcus brunensis]|uniref:Endonuclease III domain-containing protein n=1 Tax=Macrococcus brunensis TaxID=198483 RepID=A0A4R6BE18_9STAP|nr:endonuclease III domain-containing protein [Macrococcus brunensis]TDL98051.1 endonuclease III domain-containing protein [Macrococcus brunensis]ULG74574.1 endonuclease III domain-containing protein [Macrococcus brunensis]